MLEQAKGKSSPSSTAQFSLLQKRSPGTQTELYDVTLEIKKTERKVVHKIRVWLYRVLAISAMLIIGTYVLNLVLPECVCWLSPERMLLLKDQALSILTGLGVGLVLSLLHDK